MKLNLRSAFRTLHSALRTETLAVFGHARLVKQLDGKTELIGGSHDDRANERDLSGLGNRRVWVEHPIARSPCQP